MMETATSMLCRKCGEKVIENPPRQYSRRFTCCCPTHEGRNGFMVEIDRYYGCPSVNKCNWNVCETCFLSHTKLNCVDTNIKRPHWTFPQPEGLRSVHEDNPAYYCEIKSVRFEEPAPPKNEKYILLIIEYHAHGDMSMGDIPHPSYCRLLYGNSLSYHVSLWTALRQTDTEVIGELVFRLPIADGQYIDREE